MENSLLERIGNLSSWRYKFVRLVTEDQILEIKNPFISPLVIFYLHWGKDTTVSPQNQLRFLMTVKLQVVFTKEQQLNPYRCFIGKVYLFQ